MKNKSSLTLRGWEGAESDHTFSDGYFSVKKVVWRFQIS